MTNYTNEQKKVKENVFNILETSEQARNSDRLLLVAYWEQCDGIDFTNFKESFLETATSAESITRARRAIQKSGLFLPTDPEVLRQRRIRQEEARQYHAAN